MARPAPPTEEQLARLREALVPIIGTLQKDVDDRVLKKRPAELRWIEDLRQIYSEYDPAIIAELKAAEKSELFVNQTRPKSNACEARLSDMLFPTDDKNWGIQPTPVPEMMNGAKDAQAQVKPAMRAATALRNAGDPAHAVAADQAQGFADIAAQLKSEMDQAKKAADAMAAEIDDQLTECQYAIHARDVIRDACRLGTGIMKGPIGSADRARRSWSKKQADGGGAMVYSLNYEKDPRPAFMRVDPWSWFPDSDACTPDESESTFERHRLNPKAMRKLARQPGFDKAAIRRLLANRPKQSPPQYLTDLRGITGENQTAEDKCYEAWEYRGPLTAEQLRDICACLQTDDAPAIAEAHAEVDPLDEVQVVLWFCDGEVLKFGIHHLDSGESVYSVYSIDKDDASIWGFGIPYQMRDSQSAMNGAWRMMMDNGGLSCRPQIEIDTTVLEPVDGKWTFTAGKLWKRRAEAPAGKAGLIIHNIDSHQGELANIITLAKQFIDDETNISVIAQGEQGTHTTQTKGGMAMLMNAVNVVFRRMVKNFDDDMTVPNIRRLYDWNMQFSSKEHIKGDFEVDARGTSVLLVREVQSQNLMVMANMTAHPVLGILIKSAPLLRRLAQSMMIPADEIVKTDEELKQEAEKAEGKKPEMDPKDAAAMQIAVLNVNGMLKGKLLDRETALITLAQTRNMKLDQLKTLLAVKGMEVDSKERIFAGEAALEAKTPSDVGSGGYIAHGTAPETGASAAA